MKKEKEFGANFLIYDIPEQPKPVEHFKNIEGLLNKIKDVNNLKFSFENEKYSSSHISIASSNLKSQSILSILHRNGINDIKVSDLFYCKFCYANRPEYTQQIRIVEGTSYVFCDVCLKTYFKTCSVCGKEAYYSGKTCRQVDGQYFCISCYNKVYAKCFYCGYSGKKDNMDIVKYSNVEYAACKKHHPLAFKQCDFCSNLVPKTAAYSRYNDKTDKYHICCGNCKMKLENEEE